MATIPTLPDSEEPTHKRRGAEVGSMLRPNITPVERRSILEAWARMLAPLIIVQYRRGIKVTRQ